MQKKWVNCALPAKSIKLGRNVHQYMYLQKWIGTKLFGNVKPVLGPSIYQQVAELDKNGKNCTFSRYVHILSNFFP